MKTILFYTHDIPAATNPNGYRIGQYFPFFQTRGFTVLHLTTGSPLTALVGALRRADVVYLQRLLPGPLKRLLLRRFAKRIVFDYDDAIMFGRKCSNGSRERRFERIVRGSTAVFCGNHFLMDQALRHRNSGVFYVPTVVDTDDYAVKNHGPSDPLVVGWMGSASTLAYLSDIIPLFSGDGGGPVLKVVADKAPDAGGRRVLFEKWSGDREKELLRSFDVGIMPAKNDLWSRGKCGLKLIQYAAAGLPALSHPWGVSPDIIEDGKSGFLRADGPGWIEAIDELGSSVELRKRMGAAARQVAEERFSLCTWGPRVVEMVNSL